MEASGLVQRKRNDEDRRKINVFLTGRGRELENILMPLAKEVVDASVEGFSINERGLLLQYLKSIQKHFAITRYNIFRAMFFRQRDNFVLYS